MSAVYSPEFCWNIARPALDKQQATNSSVWAPCTCTQAFSTIVKFQSPWYQAGYGPGNQLPALAVTRQPFERKPVERTGVRTARKLLDSIIAAAIPAVGFTTRYKGRSASYLKRMEDEISS